MFIFLAFSAKMLTFAWSIDEDNHKTSYTHMTKSYRLFFLLCACLIVTGLTAAPVTKEQAREKALSFLRHQGRKANVQLVSVVESKRLKVRGAKSEPFYVFNEDDSDGFVIVSADDRTEAILGYGTSGEFDGNNLPDNMRAWLEGYAMQIANLQEHNVQVLQMPMQVLQQPAIHPLIKTQWDQGTPYNNLCPKTSNGHATYSGCVATAVAQVMYYHKWPEQTSGNIPGYTTRSQGITLEELPQTSFSWDAMKLTYRGNETSEEAVATLMRYVGQALHMDYGPDGSGTMSEYIPDAMVTYFDYDPNIYLAYREDYTIDEWDNLIYHELEEGRPVLYSGSSMSVGHQFVCDGYDGNGLFHINWGWGGFKDSYFRLSILNPLSTEGAGSGTTPDGFANGQSAIIGMQPPTGEEVVPRVSLPDLSMFYNDNNYITAYFQGYRLRGYYDCGIARELADGSFEVLSETTAEFGWGRGGQVDLSLESLVPDESGYKLVAVCRKNNTDEWSRVGTTLQYVDVTYDDQQNTNVVVHPVENLVVEDFRLVGEVKANTLCKLEIDLKNLGDEYNGYLYVMAVDGGDYGGQYPAGYTTIAMLPGETETFTLYYEPPSAEDLHLWLLSDSYVQLYHKTFPAYDLEISSTSITENPLVVKVTVRNNSDYDFEGKFRATVYLKNKKKGQLDKEQLIPAHGETEFVYDTFNLNEAGYYMKFAFQKNEISTAFVSLDNRIELPYSEPTGIDEVFDAISIGNAKAYNLMGQEVNDKTAKGIIVRNGKKYINK